MQKYIVRLKSDYNESINYQLIKEGIETVFSDGVLVDLIIIRTEIPLSELRNNPKFKSVEKERIGRLNI